MRIDENERRKEIVPRSAKINFAQIFSVREKGYTVFFFYFPKLFEKKMCEHVEDQREKKRLVLVFQVKNSRWIINIG